MNYIKTYETFSKLTFEINENSDKVNIIGYLNEYKVGEIIIEFILDGFWMFEDIMDEDRYDQIFPQDEFAKIEHLEIEEPFRQKGYSRNIMQKGLDYIKDQKESTVYLNASPLGYTGLNIYDLVNFYKSFGFITFIEDQGNEEMILNF